MSDYDEQNVQEGEYENPALKHCPGCGIRKSREIDFSKDASTASGANTYCKNCVRRRRQVDYLGAMVRSSLVHDRNAGRDDSTLEYITKQRIADLLIMQENRCYYCTDTMVYGIGINRSTHPDGLTVERIDNDIGHVIENCVLACKRCNTTRQSHLSHEEMVQHGADIKHGIKKRCCGPCKGIIPVANFGRCRSMRDGLSRICRVCARIPYARRRQRRREMRGSR